MMTYKKNPRFNFLNKMYYQSIFTEIGNQHSATDIVG